MGEDFPRTLLELERRFSAEDACAEYLAALRWPDGWVCPRCARVDAWSVRRNRWLCDHCRYEMSVTAGTIFQDSHLPLTIWFRAMWQITSQKNGISALGLQRVLGLGSYKTAWAMLISCVGPWFALAGTSWMASSRWTRPTGAGRKRAPLAGERNSRP